MMLACAADTRVKLDGNETAIARQVLVGVGAVSD